MVIDNQCPIFVQILIKFQILLKMPILLIKSKESADSNKWTVIDMRLLLLYWQKSAYLHR